MLTPKLCLLLLACSSLVLSEQESQYPQGYYPFEESPAKIPPKVRKPPYLQTQVACPGVGSFSNEQTLDNLCGDLNKGYLPLNPIGQNVEGVSYPFDVMKTMALKFFSKTLPILKADDTLPKVAKYEEKHISYNPNFFHTRPSSKISFYHHRTKRSENDKENQKYYAQLPRQARGWCDNSQGVLCSILNVFRDNKQGNEKAADRIGGDSDISPEASTNINRLDSPMTPCPSAVEYVTPVFAKNYQGVWRYVVQIPYEGYFTQTVEVVKCLSTKCEYLDGSCLASPRWVSLLVAEIYYPDTTFPNPGNPNSNRAPVQGGNPPSGYNNGYFSKRNGDTEEPSNCDGHDDMGCYQVRLYYDWFLIPGSCKCWKNDFFQQYTRKK